MKKPWYIDRSCNISSIFQKDYYPKLIVSSGPKKTNDMLEYLGLVGGKNPNAILTYFRDLGLLKENNELTDFFKTCIESKISSRMITLLILIKRHSFKEEPDSLMPFIVIAKALKVMHEMGYDISLTWTICANHLMNIQKYNEIDEELIQNAVADTSDATSKSVLDIWFNALIFTGLFEGSAQKITLKNEYIDFIKFVADYGQEITANYSKDDYWNQLDDAKHGLYSMVSKHPFEAISGLAKLPELSSYLKIAKIFDNNKNSVNPQISMHDILISSVEEIDDLTVDELGKLLREMYNNADSGSKVSSIHVFGIKFGKIIRKNNYKSSEIIRAAGINKSYETELHKGLSSFDSIKNNKYGVTFSDENKEEELLSNKNNLIEYAWFVGATGEDENGVWMDFSEQYIAEGRWENGCDKSFVDSVKLMKVGDRIALKSTSKQKHNLPFNNNGKWVGFADIKAIGTITNNLNDGKNIEVDWEKFDTPRRWYSFCGFLRDTLDLVRANDGYTKKALLEFVFNGIEQDYSLCEDKYALEPSENTTELESLSAQPPKYDKTDFLNDVFYTSDEYERLKQILEYKKNIILQGAPGVGKTFLAKRFAYSLMEKPDASRIEIIQFHQNYSYEDFIMGYKPDGEGFSLQNGIFYDFCKRAEGSKDPYYFIIDEINRGNVSKIFGELMMLIENDKRGKESAKLAYRDEWFTVPENVYIIGMMNTADRSIAIMDYALRRRFSFVNVDPAFEKSNFETHLLENGISTELTNKIINNFSTLNEYILDEKNSGLGSGFRIGHSYFCDKPNCDEKRWYENIIEFEIAPLLEEYWFDEKDKVSEWIGKIK